MGCKKCVYFLFGIFLTVSVSGCGEQKKWYEEYPVVCHAPGETEEGDTLTNSLEAFV